MVNIKGLNKAKVLKALYDHSHEQGMGFLQAVPNGYVTVEHCEELLEESAYFDYLYGRVLKVDLSGDEFDERLYDRDCGPGAARRAVESIDKADSCIFKLVLDSDLQVSVDRDNNEVYFKVSDPKHLDALIFMAENLRNKMKS